MTLITSGTPASRTTTDRTSQTRYSLADLPILGRARIIGIEASPFAGRLRDLGLCPGTIVEFDRRAPLGDPLVFLIRGTRLCLRRTAARTIEVESL